MALRALDARTANGADRWRRRCLAAEARAAQTGAALDRIELGVLLVDRYGASHFVNRVAARMLARGDALHLEDRTVCAADPAQTAHLRHLILAAAAANSGAEPGDLHLRLTGTDPRCSLMIRAMPLGPGNPTGPARVALFLDDGQPLALSSASVLARHFGLTPREAAIGWRLAQGHTLPAVADALGIAPATVRTHLKHLFRKTGTARQADLVRCLLSVRW
ncbi:helix-turn-helix transcriptional regulator [Pandoraea terrae]|uniref:Helix-turn-helix transcriptional regulator n=1 Tax=Pandoraea terrae TaxID=1537710 RepID=A0A5E4TUP7_9BURK|nr:helix-turn-helix transcriptional regulator [Pandoraea terrae]VVD91321.1 helix-turn-helix transcriptional regulator [Pandoraea terrae]